MNNELDWFDSMFADKSAGRAKTFKKALQLLNERATHNIVETGCLRQENDYGAGYSTFIFGEFCKRLGGHISTVDISDENMSVCMMITAPYKEFISYYVDDSLNFLKNYDKYIDLLYLDSLDVPLQGDAAECQEHNLKEFKIAEPLLTRGSIILLDDNEFDNGGKTRLTKVYLEEKGYKEIMGGQQSLWVK